MTDQVARGINPNLITVENKAELLHLTNRINEQTLQLPPITKVRIGSSTHSRLAQMNIRLRQMTISCHAIKNVPMRALRYLILHELCHLVHADHSSDFWDLVETCEPDYKYYDKLIKAFHELKSLGIEF
jgi:predicted metal-dependent hydrolase